MKKIDYLIGVSKENNSSCNKENPEVAIYSICVLNLNNGIIQSTSTFRNTELGFIEVLKLNVSASFKLHSIVCLNNDLTLINLLAQHTEFNLFIHKGKYFNIETVGITLTAKLLDGLKEAALNTSEFKIFQRNLGLVKYLYNKEIGMCL